MGAMWWLGAIVGWLTAAWIIGPALGLTKGAFEFAGGEGWPESNRAMYYGAYR